MRYYQKGRKDKDLKFPLTAIPDPKGGKLVCPKIGKRHGLKDFPFSQMDNLLREVLKARLEVEKGIYPQWLMDQYYPFKGESPKGITVALRMEGLSEDEPDGLAQVVHMDMPNAMPEALLRWFNYVGVQLKKPTDGHIDFLGYIPHTTENIGDGVKKALDEVFEAKSFFGIARPEELFECKTGVKGELMTAYEEGCPLHTSFPAGHSAAAGGGVRRLMEDFILTDYHLKEVLDTAYLWGMFRTLAGVHYGVDNVAGLIIGGLGKYMRKDVLDKYLI